jgi:hypothetical protein
VPGAQSHAPGSLRFDRSALAKLSRFWDTSKRARTSSSVSFMLLPSSDLDPAYGACPRAVRNPPRARPVTSVKRTCYRRRRSGPPWDADSGKAADALERRPHVAAACGCCRSQVPDRNCQRRPVLASKLDRCRAQWDYCQRASPVKRPGGPHPLHVRCKCIGECWIPVARPPPVLLRPTFSAGFAR